MGASRSSSPRRGPVFSALPLNLGQFWHRTYPRGADLAASFSLLSCPLLIRLSFEQARASDRYVLPSSLLTHPLSLPALAFCSLILPPLVMQCLSAAPFSMSPLYCSVQVRVLQRSQEQCHLEWSSGRFSHSGKLDRDLPDKEWPVLCRGHALACLIAPDLPASYNSSWTLSPQELHSSFFTINPFSTCTSSLAKVCLHERHLWQVTWLLDWHSQPHAAILP